MARKKKDPTPVLPELDANRHHDTRKNIPTEELRDFVAEDESKPPKMLYPRDPSLDPQLVWKGKDGEDRESLEVDIVPIYIQEVIEPRVIVEAVQARKRTKPETSGFLPGFFDDFDAMDFDRKIEFYQHDQKWANRMILGNSLHVMTSLAEKEGLKGKVQMIYIDPPYGIKFGSNWQVSTRKCDVKDGKAEDATRQPEQVRAFRDTWKYGIHFYLEYLRDRLVVARELLTDTGSVLVQIGDENVHLVRCLMDEVLGSKNMVSLITFVKTSAQEDNLLPSVCDHVLWYAADRDQVKYRQLWLEKTRNDPSAGDYNMVLLADGSSRRMTSEELANVDLLPDRSRIFTQDNIVSQRPPGDFPVEFEERTYRPITGYWKTGVDGMSRLIWAKRIQRRGSMLRYVRYLDDFSVRPVANFWTDVRFSSRVEEKTYVVQTAAKVIERCILLSTDPGDLVLDPTCGSGTTAYIAEQWGRRWITIDTSRVALALARTRLMAARFPYYYLADSCPQMTQMTADEDIKNYLRQSASSADKNSSSSAGGFHSPPDIRKGFVYKRVPHVTLKSIANNPDIKEGMTRDEIDAAIARHAESETLYDQPYEDKKTVRVSGPFTVESLSPHRTISVEEKKRRSEVGKNGWRMKVIGPDCFATMILDNLRKAGMQNTVKGERLKFDSLDPFAGEWIHAQGSYTEKDGKVR